MLHTRTFQLDVRVEKNKVRFLFPPKDSHPEHSIDVSQFWLRDNCRCQLCVNKDTLQKDFDTFDVPGNIKAEHSQTQQDGVHVTWSDQHVSFHPWNWVKSMAPSYRQEGVNAAPSKAAGWSANSWDEWAEARETNYKDVMDKNGTGMAKLTAAIHHYGLGFVKNTPVSPEATEELLERIGPVRNTHYGGFYDFVPDLAKADTAYTNIALGAHTDTTYFTEPTGLQAFHMLSHIPPPGEPSGALGGESLLCDGFYAAEKLREKHPEYFKTLCEVKIPWHASGNEDVAIAPDATYPVIETESGLDGPIRRIRWNNSDRGVVPLEAGFDVVDRWYAAARELDSIIKSKESECWFQLQPGTVLVFDNWRILHGRAEFKGLRRMCGAYINRDDFVSRWKLSNYDRADVILHNMWQHR